MITTTDNQKWAFALIALKLKNSEVDETTTERLLIEFERAGAGRISKRTRPAFHTLERHTGFDYATLVRLADGQLPADFKLLLEIEEERRRHRNTLETLRQKLAAYLPAEETAAPAARATT